MISADYSAVKHRFDAVRGVLHDLVEDPKANRCAAVIGGSLLLHPNAHQHSFAESPDLKPEFRQMPFVHKYFLKAGELASTIQARYGKPDRTSRGIGNKDVRNWPRGIIYLEHCWPTPREKFKNLGHNLLQGNTSFIGDLQSGDHIDLWDGQCLEIERNEAGQGFVLIMRAQAIQFWQLGRNR